MTEDELFKQFRREFERDCWEPSCESMDCEECEIFQDGFEEYKQALGYMPSISIHD